MLTNWHSTLAILFITIILTLASTIPVASQSAMQPIPTATPFPVRSLFAEDSCSPPCWFGLTPGISTGADVQQFVQSMDTDVFDRVILDPDSTLDPETGAVVFGNYSIRWHFEAGVERIYRHIIVWIFDDLVERISVGTGRRIYLDELLNALGQSDYIAFNRGVYGQFHFYLEYFDPRLSILMESVPLYYDCSVSNIWETYQVERIVYYPPLKESVFLGSSRHVPPETWQAWLNGEETANCYEAWEALEEQASFHLQGLTN